MELSRQRENGVWEWCVCVWEWCVRVGMVCACGLKGEKCQRYPMVINCKRVNALRMKDKKNKVMAMHSMLV